MDDFKDNSAYCNCHSRLLVDSSHRQVFEGSPMADPMKQVATLSRDTQPSHLADNSLPASDAPNSNRLFYIDFLRCFATIQVILLHASAPMANAVSSPGLFWVGCIFNSLTRSCVPLFLLISGMLLLSSLQSENAGTFLKRRIWRIGMPLVSWTAIYSIWMATHGLKLDWLTVVNQPACYHLHYLYYLAGLYLAVPIFKAFLRGASKQDVFYFLALWFASASVLPLVGSLTGVRPPFLFAVATGFSGYFILGYVLRDYQISKRQLPLASLIAATCLLATIMGTYWLSFSAVDKKLDQTLFNYTSPQIIVYSAILFLAAKLLVVKPRKRWLAGLIEAVSAASFTIYLVHPIFLDTVCLHLRWMLDLHTHRSLITVAYILAVSSVTFLLSWAFYLLCRLFRVPTWIAP
ncbi:MAG: hypothetical protein C0469_00940 [Cyanobacteria bacterium DS2.3.42]|nr:hypothetical protein [Cyanobacteria bacterium DS2.3.42]